MAFPFVIKTGLDLPRLRVSVKGCIAIGTGLMSLVPLIILHTIKEGNPNPEKIGAFGVRYTIGAGHSRCHWSLFLLLIICHAVSEFFLQVGYYSVFSICEEPMVISGNQALAFVWKGVGEWLILWEN